ncbi:MAG: helix-turn-helix transcriptional regulator, partial [Chloroflexi bacterium]|nr:helix-turn-helix transcriptional regulator [Chloroflexota bacterium]
MADRANEPFATLRKRHRLAAGLTQEDVAERAGISARAVSDLELGGGRTPRLETVGLLATALGLAGEERRAFLAAARPAADAAARGPAPRLASSSDVAASPHEPMAPVQNELDMALGTALPV